MTQPRFDVVAIGNAIVDVLSHESDAFLDEQGLVKGSMRLIEADEADRLYDRMGPAIEMSGGSGANTAVGIASFGSDVAYVGKVRDDQLGRVFAHDIRASGVAYDVAPAVDGQPTARCLILVTPDAQRTMNTFLGISGDLSAVDVDDETVAAGQVLYLEGYLWDRPVAKEAMRHAIGVARAAGRQVAFTLSDGFCVDRHRDEFRALVEDDVDVLFANEAELCALYQVDDFDDALQAIRGNVEVAALTRGAKGSVVLGGDEVHVIDAEPVERVVDTTGAGDQYAAGFLVGLTRGSGLADCGRLGGLAAAEVISHLGARPETSLAPLAGRVLG